MELFRQILAILGGWFSFVRRPQQLCSRHRHRAMIGVRRLEERIVLDASFAMTGGQLDLNNFTGDSTAVTVSEGQFDFGGGAGNQDVYTFQLNKENWVGGDVAGVTSKSGETLHVLKSALDDQLQITDSLDNGLMVALQALGMETSGGPVNADLSITAQTINLNGDLTTNGKDVLLNGATTIVQNVAITTTNTDPTQDAGNVTFGGTVNAAALTRALTVNAGASGTGQAGDVTFQNAVGTSTNFLGVTVSGKDVLFGDNVAVRAGGITVESTGNTTFDGTIATTANGGSVQITSGGMVTLNENVTTTNGTVQIAGEGDITLRGDVHSGNGAVKITSGAAIVLNANVNAGNQTINLSAEEDITLGQLTTSNSSSDAVSVKSENGAILDGNDDALNISTTNANAVTTLRAARGIGSGDALELSVSKLDSENRLSGDIQFVETNAVTILNLQQLADGNINLIASGTITVNNGDTVVVQTAGDGQITLTTQGTSSNLTIQSGVQSAGGAITLTTQGTNSNLTIQSGVESAGGMITLTSGRDVIQSALGNVASHGGDVTVNAGRVFTMSNGLVIDAGMGKIDIHSSGDATLGLLKSQKTHGEAIKVVSETGRILAASNTVLNIDANGDDALTILSARTGIGTTNWLNVHVAELDVNNTTSGNIRIAESDDVTIVNLVQDGTGNIELTALNGSIGAKSANSRVETQSGTISLEAADNITLGQVETDNNSVNAIKITSHTGAIQGMAGIDPNIVTTGASAVTTLSAATGIGSTGQALRTEISRLSATNSTSGEISITEVDDVTVTSLKQTNTAAHGGISLIAGGTITLTNPNTIQTQGTGDVLLQATGAGANILVQGKIIAEQGDVALDAQNNVEFTASGQISTTGNVTLTVLNEIKGAGSGTHIVANEFTATAAAGVTLLNTSVSSLSVTNTTSGNIQIKEADDVTVTHLIQTDGTGNIALTTVNGSITVDAGNPTTAAVQANGAGTILLQANRTAASSQNLNVLSGVTSDAGTVTLLADQNLTIGPGVSIVSQTGNLSATATRGELEMQGTSMMNAGSGTVTLKAAGNVTLGHVTTTNDTAAAVSVTSQNGAILDGGNTALVNILADSPAAVTTLSASTGIGVLDTPLRVDLDRLFATNSGVTGDIAIEEVDTLTVLSLRQSNTTGNGNIELKTLDGPLTINNSSASVIAVQTYGTGSISLKAGGTDSDLAVQSKISTVNGNVTMAADRDALFGEHGDMTSLTGSIDVAAAGEIQMTAGAQFNAGTGTISLTADGDITLAELRTTNATSSAVSITSEHGAILDGNGNVSNILAAGSTAVTTLRAANGIGTADALEVDLGQLDAVNTASGDIQLVESNAITVLNLQQANTTGTGSISLTTVRGSITVDAPGNDVNDVAVQVHETGTITLLAGGTSADLIVLDAVRAEQGTITLQAGRQIGFDANGNVTTSQDVVLQAGSNITTTGSQLISAAGLTAAAGSGIVLNTSVERLSATNGSSGNVEITETDDVTVTALKQTSGNGNLSLITKQGSITVDNGQSPPADTVAVDAKGNGTVLLQAQGAGSELILNSAVRSANGTITLGAEDKIAFGEHGDVTTTGANASVSITSVSSEVVMHAGTEIRAGGEINLAAENGDVTLGYLRSARGSGNAVTVTSGGAILDGNGTALNIDANATGALTTLTAVNGIGAASPNDPLDQALEINVNRISATNQSSGDLRLQENDAVSVVNLTQTTSPGDIELIANGPITIEETTPGSSAVQANGPGTITLQSQGTTSDLSVQGGISSDGGTITLNADRSVSFGTNGDVNSHGGDVTVTATSGTLQMADGSSIDAGSGQIILQAQGTVTLGELNSTRFDSTNPIAAITITSTAGAIQDGNGAALNLNANGENAVTRLRSATGIATAVGNPLETQVTILDAVNSTNGSIQIQEADDITVTNLRQKAGSGNVSLVTVDGDITIDISTSDVIDNPDSTTVQTFSVGTITLDAGGTDSNLMIQSQIQSVSREITLTAENDVTLKDHGNVISQSGNIFITAEAGAVQILDNLLVQTGNNITVGAETGVELQGLLQTTNSGNIQVTTAHGDLVVNNGASPAVQAGGVGKVTLDAQGDDSNLMIQSQIESVSREITLTAGNNVTLKDHGNVKSSAGNIFITAEAGAVQILDGLTVQTGNNITVGAETGVELQGLLQTTNSGNIQVTTAHGDLVVNNGASPAVQAGGVGKVTLDAQGDDSNLMIQSQIQSVSREITLTAGNNVTLKDHGNVKSSAGNIFITAEAGAVQILDNLLVQTGNNITVGAETGVELQGLLQTTNSGNIQVSATNGDVVVNNGTDPAVKAGGVGIVDIQGSNLFIESQIQSTSREITLTAENDVTLKDHGNVISQSGNIFITAEAGTVQILDNLLVQTGNNITIGAETGVELQGLLQTTNSGNIQVTTAHGDLVVNNGASPAVQAGGVGTVTLDAQGDDSNLMIQSQVESVSREITLTAGNNVTLKDHGNVKSSAGNIFITAEAGTVQILDNLLVQTGNNITVGAETGVELQGLLQTTNSGNIQVTTAHGDLVVNNGASPAVQAGGVGKVTLDAQGDDSNLMIQSQIESVSREITLTAGNNITFGEHGEVSSTAGAVFATAQNGFLFMDDGAEIQSGTGRIHLEAQQDITLGQITTGNASSQLTDAAVMVTSHTGAIIDGNDAGMNIVANHVSSAVVLSAITGIGADDALEVNVRRLNAEVTGTGGIQIQEADNIILSNVQTANGSITITANGSITATNVISQTDADANDISLTSTGGGILVQNINAGTVNGDVILQALGGAIGRSGTALQINVTADDLIATSVSGIDLYTDINDLVAFVSGTGDILIEESNDINLASWDAGTDDARIETINGRIQIRAAGSITIVDTDGSNDGTDRRGDEEIIAGGFASSDAASAGRILLQAGNIGATTGSDLIFQKHAQISAVDAGGDRGAIVLIATGNFEFDSDTSQITTYKDLGGGVTQGGVLRTPIPTIDNLTGGNPNLVASGNDYRGTFEVQLGAGTEGEKGLEIHIDWGALGNERFEGPDYGNQTALNGPLQGLDGETRLTLAHDYTIEDVQFAKGNGRQNLTDPLQVRFMVSHDPSITIFANTLNANPTGKLDGDLSLLTTSNNLQGPHDQLPLDPMTLLGESLSTIQSGHAVDNTQLTTTVNTLITPQRAEMLETGVQTFRVPPIILPRDLLLVRDPGYPAASQPIPAVPPAPIVTAAVQVVPSIPVASSTTFFRDEYFQIKALSPDPNADAPLAPPERLPDDILSGDRLNQLFQQLPDGQYQIDYVLGEGNERSILKFDIRQGQPVVPGGEELDGGQLKLEDITEELKRATESTTTDAASIHSDFTNEQQATAATNRAIAAARQDVQFLSSGRNTQESIAPHPAFSTDAGSLSHLNLRLEKSETSANGAQSRETEPNPKLQGRTGHGIRVGEEAIEAAAEFEAATDQTGPGSGDDGHSPEPASAAHLLSGASGPAIMGATALLRQIRRRRQQPASFSATGRLMQRLRDRG